MDFGDDHYTRDWALLARIVEGWAEIQQRFHLGSKATRKQIEEFWDPIFCNNEMDYPSLRRLHHHLMRDEALIRHLRKCFWKNLKHWQRGGYTFEEVLAATLMRIFWEVVRNAHKWLKSREKLVHWGRFWNDQGLTGHLNRAIQDLEKDEGSFGIQPKLSPEKHGSGKTHEVEEDYQGRKAERPEEPLEKAEVEAQGKARFGEKIRHYCTAAGVQLVEEYMNNSRDLADAEKLELRRIFQKIKRRKK